MLQPRFLRETILAKVSAFYDMQVMGCMGTCPECGAEEELKRSVFFQIDGNDFRLFFHGTNGACFYGEQNMVLSTLDGRWRLVPRSDAF